MRSNNTIVLALVLTIFAAFPTPGYSQTDWPTKPVSLVVGYPAGSATDAAARVVTGLLAKKSGSR